MVKKLIFILLDSFGYRLTRRHKEYEYSRYSIYQSRGIERIIDIGANTGQFAQLMRKLGYSGRIQSFEPMKFEYNQLLKNSRRDNNWEVFNFGLGEFNEDVEINVSQNSYSSSLLELTDIQLQGDSASIKIKTEPIRLVNFQTHFKNDRFSDRVALKLDVQGYELVILKSIEDILSSFVLIQLEVSLKELYQGESLYFTIDEFLRNNKFELVSVEPGFYNRQTGEMLQSDFIYARLQ